MKDYQKIIDAFDIDTKIVPYGDGHINDTYLTDSPKCILQKMNTSVFKNPEELMENICAVTEHLKKKIIQNGGNPARETLTLIKTRDGKNFHRCGDECYRMYFFIDGARTYNNAQNPKQLYNAAKAFGRFQNMMADFPAESLHETIKNFHCTPDRLNQLREAVERDRAGRAAGVKNEIDFAFARAADAPVITDAIKSGKIPVRVTHNDTKLNNVMLDEKTGEGICVIDLDTVMPGSMLYDFGDALRFAGSSGTEDETDLSKIWFDLDYFEAFAKGFLEELSDTVTKEEKILLPFSVKLMTYECGMRFLADYINGDTYFKVSRDGQNLDRARTQFKLVSDIENKMDMMKKIIEEI